jgi:Flp pilus assembly protein TadG
MLKPLIRRRGHRGQERSSERGFTMALVTVALVAIIGMAALSIDIGTLYQAKAEAQRAADTAALAGARVISLSGVTADPNGAGDGTWSGICGGSTSPATLTAQAVAEQNTIAGVTPAASSINVTYSAGSSTTKNADCSQLSGTEFAINPVVNVTVTQANLPIFFARVFSLLGMNYTGSSVSASASAEGYNPSNSGNGSPVPTPVVPRCVKPWIIPNSDPVKSGFAKFVDPTSGSINNPGVDQLGFNASTVGETFNLYADCTAGLGGCTIPNNGTNGNNPPQYSSTLGEEYIPAAVGSNPGAVPTCATADLYQEAIAGCDTSTVYACGVQGGTAIDLIDYNPGGGSGDTSTAVQCLVHQSGGAGQDTLVLNGSVPAFPLQIQAGAGSALVKASLVNSGNTITSSNSIVTIPIANFTGGVQLTPGSSVTIVGFLQGFINSVDTSSGSTGGNVSVTVLNVAGCGDASTGTPDFGSSPVPIRLITPP